MPVDPDDQQPELNSVADADDWYTQHPHGADCQPCAPICALVFDRVVVSYLVTSGTLVMWELAPAFEGKQPLTFTLQVGHTDNNDADDWEDVGLPVVDQYSALDGEQRAWGKTNWTHYRIKLVTSDEPALTYYSEPTAVAGTLGFRDWRIVREIMRKEEIWQRLNFVGQAGYLLKRRWTGTKCPVCTDFQTGEVRNPDCPTCFGTGYNCGYYFPTACVWASFQPKTYRTKLDGAQGRGTINDVVLRARMLNISLLSENDVWVALKTDDRFYVHEVANKIEVRGFALVADVELRPIPFSSIVYTIAIPQQLEHLGDLIGTS